MHKYDERLELAPRDVVSHAIMAESQATGSDDFYLDISHKDSEFLKNRFPMIYQNLLKQGYDLTKDRIPIFPCQHYLMGGINVDSFARTKVNGLYAVGECSHTGVHGNNRLASNSLLEALVFSRRGAGDINAKADTVSPDFEQYEFVQPDTIEVVPHGIRTEVRHIMQKSYFVIPDKKSAVEGFERIKDLKKLLTTGTYVVDADYVEARSLVTVAYLILKEVI
jgi:L-aspartate oxidase